MPIEIRAILCFFRDYIGKIMILLGALFVFIAVLFLTQVYQWVSSLSLLFGVILMIIGIALHFESFKWKVPSLGGFGTVLIYLSPVFMAAAVATAIFAVPKGAMSIPLYGGLDEHGSPFVYTPPGKWQTVQSFFVVVLLERPNAWLAAPLMLTGLGLLGFGCLLKFASDTI